MRVVMGDMGMAGGCTGVVQRLDGIKTCVYAEASYASAQSSRIIESKSI